MCRLAHNLVSFRKFPGPCVVRLTDGLERKRSQGWARMEESVNEKCPPWSQALELVVLRYSCPSMGRTGSEPKAGLWSQTQVRF